MRGGKETEVTEVVVAAHKIWKRRFMKHDSGEATKGTQPPLFREVADEYHFGRITIQMHAFGNAPPQPSAAPPKGEPRFGAIRNLLPPPGEVPRSGQGGVLGGVAT